jgi:FeS assembly SUF system protein
LSNCLIAELPNCLIAELSNCRIVSLTNTSMRKQIEKDIISERIVQVIKTIYDPEIPVNIYDLGLIYTILVDDDFVAHVTMTLTAPNCPVAESLPIEVHETVKNVEGVTDAKVTLTFEPPWDRNMISESGMLELGFL